MQWSSWLSSKPNGSSPSKMNRGELYRNSERFDLMVLPVIAVLAKLFLNYIFIYLLLLKYVKEALEKSNDTDLKKISIPACSYTPVQKPIIFFLALDACSN
jgi:hypothetical protein